MTLGGQDLHVQLAKATEVLPQSPATLQGAAHKVHRLVSTDAQGEAWKAFLSGHQLQDSEQESEKKRLLLERFQEEVALSHL